MRYNVYNADTIVFSTNNIDEALNYTHQNEGEFEIIEKQTLVAFNRIKVPVKFKASVPKQYKLDKYRKIYSGSLTELLALNPIVIDQFDNTLIDGYCSYLILKESGYKGDIPVSLWSDTRKARIVFGKHYPDGKTYAWKISEGKYRYIGGIEPGNKLKVSTKFGIKTMTVTKVIVVQYIDTRLQNLKKVVGKVKEGADNG
jgi:hypothetical protein